MEIPVTTQMLVESGHVLKCPECGEHSSAARKYVSCKDSPMSADYGKGETAPIVYASHDYWECGHCQALNLKDAWWEPVADNGHALTLR